MIDNIKNKVKTYVNNNVIFYGLLVRLWKRPYLLGVDFLFCYIYSTFISFKIFGFSFIPKVFFSKDLFRVIVRKGKHCKIVTGNEIPIIFESFNHGVDRTILVFASDSKIHIENSFYIGNGCIITVSKNALLKLLGSDDLKISGITSNSKIICNKNIEIGKSTIISWNCYITDSTNHKINGQLLNHSVYIGNKVWISEGCTIAPNTYLDDGIIVGAKSYVNNKFKKNVLIAGCPARIKKENISWER